MSRLLQQRGAMAAAILGLSLLAVLAVWGLDPWAEQGNDRPASFQLDLQRQFTIDPALIGYRLDAEIPVPMEHVRAIATGPDNRIYVAGDQAVQVFRADGTDERMIPLSAAPSCLTVAGAGHAEPGRIFVGVNGQVESWQADGQAAGQWQVPGETPRLTSLAVAEEDLFVADAASRLRLAHSPWKGNRWARLANPTRLGNAPPSSFRAPISTWRSARMVCCAW